MFGAQRCDDEGDLGMRRRTLVTNGWLVVAGIAAVLTATSGARQLYGVVLKPVSEDFGWSRSSLTGAVLVNMLVLSVCQPLIGALADRIGPKPILVCGSLALGLALIPLSFATALWQFYLFYGVVVALALSATSPVNVTALVTRWFTKRRSTALSIATSGSAFGQLLIVPLAAWILMRTDWETTYLLLAALLIVVFAPIGWFLIRDAPPDIAAASEASDGRTERHPSSATERRAVEAISLKGALRTPSFWFLVSGFFTCGFTMAFASTHFMAFADDMGMGEMAAADVVAVTAIFSIGGSLLLGMLADRYARQRVLGLTYALRGLAFAFLFLFFSESLIYVYAVILGISWTATTPLTAAISADLYGRRNIGVIFGTMYTFMNIGFGVGSFLDGVVYDAFGDYNFALVVNAALGFIAALLVLRVTDGGKVLLLRPGPSLAAPVDEAVVTS
jgi:MFS family permease